MLTTETQIGWQDYLAIIVRRRWFFIIPCAAIVGISMVVGLVLPKVYRAETILLVQEQGVMNPLIQGLAVSTPVGERLRTLREELLGWTSLSRLIDELKLHRQAKSLMAFETLVKRLQRDIAVGMRGGNLIVIAFEDRDPKLAQTLVNTITSIYMARNSESQTAEAKSAIGFIESEMAVYKKKLEDAERALREFKELYVTQMPVATQLNEQIVQMEVSVARLLVDNTEEHPTVIQLKQQVEELKQKRNAEIKRVIATAMAKGHDPEFYHSIARALEEPTGSHAEQDPAIRAAQQAYQSWVERLDTPGVMTTPSLTSPQIQVVTGTDENAGSSIGLVSSGAPSISLAPLEEQELARLTRDYEVHAQTYQHMQGRLERAKITQRLGKSDEGTKFKVLEPARLPLRPVRPNLVKMFFFSLLLGVFVGAGTAFVAEYLDQSFQSAEDVQAALELPVIGSISTIVTEEDIAKRRRNRKDWLFWKTQGRLIREYVLGPVWAQIDRALIRLKL